MSLRDFIAKQWIDVIEWVEPEEGILAYRIHAGSRNPERRQADRSRFAAAVFVNEGKVATPLARDSTPSIRKAALLTYLKNWDKRSQVTFKSDVYFFSTRIQTDQHWGRRSLPFHERNSAPSGFGSALLV